MTPCLAVPWLFVAGLLLAGGPALPGPIAEEIRKADRVALFEGLPHQMHERELRQRELSSAKVVRHEGIPFYEEEIVPSAEAAAALTRILGDPAVYVPHAGYKDCGGFHPDYLVMARAGADGPPTRLHLCFGCLEMKAYGPGGEAHLDLTPEAARDLLTILKAYGENRPDSRARRTQWNAVLGVAERR